MQEAVYTLARFLQRFSATEGPGHKVHPCLELTMRPADFYVRLQRRETI